jgi:hypothetical protein
MKQKRRKRRKRKKKPKEHIRERVEYGRVKYSPALFLLPLLGISGFHIFYSAIVTTILNAEEINYG